MSAKPRPVVVDASVAVKWCLPDEHLPEAEALLGPGYVRLCPDLLFAEVGNALWKRVRAGRGTGEDAQQALAGLRLVPWRITPAWLLAEAALELALQTGRTVYDCLYLALAVREDTVLVTADEKLRNALADGPLANRVLWIEDLPESTAPNP